MNDHWYVIIWWNTDYLNYHGYGYYIEYNKQVYYIIKFKKWYNWPLKIYKATYVHMYASACVHCSKYNSHTYIYTICIAMGYHGIGSVPGLRCDTVTVAMV